MTALFSWLRVLTLAAVALFVATQLAACEGDDFFAWATVVGVQEVDAGKLPEEFTLRDEDLRIPEVGWQVDLRLDDGKTVSLPYNRRLEPGERVRLITDGQGDLFL